MYARFGHAAVNTCMFDENNHDADSVRGKDFYAVSGGAKSMTTVSSSAKSFTKISGDSGKPFVEVGG